MPYADPEKNREYMRNYQREYMRRKRAEKRAAEGREKFQRCEHPKLGSGRCETCNKDYQAKWRRENREDQRAKRREYRERNAERRKEANARWRAANADYVKAKATEWQKANPGAVAAHVARRRAREASVPTIKFSTGLLAAKWAYWGNRCWLCGADAEQTDHVKPISKGGAHMLCNLRPICKSCNCSKSNEWPYP